MSEFLFSVLGATLIFALAVPLVTFVAKALLVLRWRRDPDVRSQGSLFSFLLIVGPSVATVLWLVSAALHQAEPGASAGVCTLDHSGLEACVDSLLLALMLSTVVVSALTYRWHKSPREPISPVGSRYFARLARLCESGTPLGHLRGRVKPTGPVAHPICTRGLLRPRVEVSTLLLDRLDDVALEAALLHEAAHLEGHDPLRYLLASVALMLNPLGFLLRPDLRRWRAAREAVCDYEAVGHEADPLSLAEAIVAASRLNRPLRTLAVGLGTPSAGLLRLRVHLLLDYAAQPPHLPARRSRWPGAWIVLALVLSPHLFGVWPLNGLHGASEQILSVLGLI